MTAGVRRMGALSRVRTGDAKVDRALDDTAVRVNHLLAGPLANAVPVEVDLDQGLNKVPHGLGAPVRHVLATLPSVAGASLSCEQADNPHPEAQLWIRLTGASRVRVLLLLLPQAG